jgi:hypothetical protein
VRMPLSRHLEMPFDGQGETNAMFAIEKIEEMIALNSIALTRLTYAASRDRIQGLKSGLLMKNTVPRLAQE